MLCFVVVDMLYIIVTQLPLVCGSRGKIFFKFFYYMRWEPVPMFFVVLFQMFLLNFYNETYVHYWELIVPLFLMVMFCWTTLILEILHKGWIQKFFGLDVFQNCFLVFCCHFFSKPTTTTTKNHYITWPIMTKTMSSATTSHVTPVKKATPGKLLLKNKLSRIGEKPRTPSNQSSPASVSNSDDGIVDVIVPINHDHKFNAIQLLQSCVRSWLC
jgi:hypothetical protein